jgi:tetratricopeptide (TPR) repeat protein
VIRSAFRYCAALILVLGCCAVEIGDAVAETAISAGSIEQQLVADARDGKLQQFELMEAALIAGGVFDPAQRAEILRIRDARYAALDLPAIKQLPLARRPAAVLTKMHREILFGKFHPNATLIQETLATGDFNCVTATLLFHDLCTRCGLNAEIVAQSGHVCSRLGAPHFAEVETTRRDWFSRATADGKPAESARRVITPTELVSRIYYNRALAALEQKEFATAIQLLERALVLDPQDHDAQENLLAGLNNWALALCEAGKHAAAAERVAAGLQLNAKYAPLLSNELHVHQQWVTQLCRDYEFEQALRVLEAGRARRPEAPLFVGGQRAVYEAWLKYCVASGDTATATLVMQQARQQLGPQARFTLEARPLPRTIPAKNRSAGGQ